MGMKFKGAASLEDAKKAVAELGVGEGEGCVLHQGDGEGDRKAGTHRQGEGAARRHAEGCLARPSEEGCHVPEGERARVVRGALNDAESVARQSGDEAGTPPQETNVRNRLPTGSRRSGGLAMF